MPIKPKLLLGIDSPYVFEPTLACTVGINEAIFLQQLHFLLRDPKNGKTIKGKRWIYNTYGDWRDYHFMWMSEISIRRMIKKLPLPQNLWVSLEVK